MGSMQNKQQKTMIGSLFSFLKMNVSPLPEEKENTWTTISVLCCGISLSPPTKTQSTQATAPHNTCQYKSTPFSPFSYSSSLTEIPRFQNSNPLPCLHHQLKFPSFVFDPLDRNYDFIHWSFISYFQFSHSNRIEDFWCLCAFGLQENERK